MRRDTQKTHTKIPFGGFCLLLILSFFLTQCGKSPKQTTSAIQTPDGGFTLSLPSEIKKHQSGKNMTAQLIVDGGTPINMTIDLDNDQVTATTGPLSPGTHSFVIQYFLDGALIATATSQAQIIAGQNTNIVFTPDLNVNIAPSVLAKQPAENANNVVTNSSVSATFSQPMDISSITSLNFTLNGLTASVTGTVTYSETAANFEARFTPGEPLALAANYTANLNTGILGILGEPLSTAESWTFTTRDGAWENPQGVDFDSVADPLNGTLFPQIALDPSGNAIAVWVQNNFGTSGPNNIWANHYLKGNGWQTPELIETNDLGHAASPQVVIDSSGNAIAVWQQNDGIRNNIWANRFDATTSLWGTANPIETDNAGTADSPQIAIDLTGNAIAVWRQSDGTNNNIIANRFDANLGAWGTVIPIESATTPALSPQIALDAVGNAIAVWVQDDGAFSIFSNRFDIGTTSWATAENIESDNTGNASSPRLAMNSSGRAIAVWLQNDGSDTNVMGSRFAPETGWISPPQTIDTETSQAFTPEIAMDPQGNASAVWRQDDGTSFHIFSNRFDSNTGLWGTPRSLETETISNLGFPQIRFDRNGNAIAVWAQLSSGDNFDNAWASRYTPSTGWQTAEKLETEDLGSAGFPQIDIDQNGNAISVWIQDDGTTRNVQSKRFQ